MEEEYQNITEPVFEEPPKLAYYNEAERQEEINKYQKFKKVDGAAYRKVNLFLRKRTYITAREWAIARLCADFKTPYGAEMTFIGQHLPELCPFMEEPYSPQAVNQARSSFKRHFSDIGNTVGYIYTFKLVTLIKRIVTNVSHAVRDLNRGQGCAVFES